MKTYFMTDDIKDSTRPCTPSPDDAIAETLVMDWNDMRILMPDAFEKEKLDDCQDCD